MGRAGSTKTTQRNRAARRRAMGLALAGAAVTLAVGALPAGASPSTGPAHGLHMQDSGKGTGSRSTSNLIDHGGNVLSASNVYVVWWGSTNAWMPDVQGGISTFFNGLTYKGVVSPFVNTATQYMRGATLAVSYVSSAAAPPSHAPSVGTIVNEAAREFPSADPQGLYLVFTSNFPKSANYCAWHSYGTAINGSAYNVAYMPNTGGIGGCDPGNLYGVGGSEDLRSLANVTSHEFMEGITDPQLSTWYDSSGQEIGDKCAWQFASAVKLSNGSTWQLQEEWINKVSGCVQQT